MSIGSYLVVRPKYPILTDQVFKTTFAILASVPCCLGSVYGPVALVQKQTLYTVYNVIIISRRVNKGRSSSNVVERGNFPNKGEERSQ